MTEKTFEEKVEQVKTKRTKKSKIKNLYQKLAEARANIGVTKTGYNNYGKFKYYELNEIYNQAKKIFNELGILTLFSLKSDDPKRSVSNKTVLAPVLDKEGKEVKDEEGNTIYKTETTTEKYTGYEFYTGILTIINTENPKEREVMEMTSVVNQMKGAQPTQNVGATNTYLCKYLYMDLLMIDDSELDPDANNDYGKKTTTKDVVKDVNNVSKSTKDTSSKSKDTSNDLKSVTNKYIEIVGDPKSIDELKSLTKKYVTENKLKEENPEALKEITSLYKDFKAALEG